MDLLIEKIVQMKNPTVAGLDPKLDYVPEYILKEEFAASADPLEQLPMRCFGSIRG